MGSCFFENCAFAVCKGRILSPSCTPPIVRKFKHGLGEGREGKGGIRTKFRSSKLLVFELRGFRKQRQVRVNGVQRELKTSLSKGSVWILRNLKLYFAAWLVQLVGRLTAKW